jgi:hypothetical protein
MRYFKWLLLPVLALLVIAAFWKLTITPIVDGDTTAAFAGDLAEYVSAHNGMLPTNWTEFAEWMKKTKESARWKAVELERRFAIRIPRQHEGATPPVYIEVIDPQLRNMQDFINRAIQNAKNS